MMAVTTGSALHWGPLWNVRATEWAGIEEQQIPTYRAALDRLALVPGAQVLEVGCGSGVYLSLAAARGAEVHGVDASEDLIAIAARRLPGCDLQVGDMQSLPYPDDSFDVVAGFNAFFFAADMTAALREARRVARPGAPVVIQVYGRPERCDLEAMKRAIAPSDPDAPAQPPLCAPGVLEKMARAAGLAPGETFDVSWSYSFADDDALVRAMLSAGPIVAAAAQMGEDTVARAILGALAPCRTPGGYAISNEWHFLIARA
jgi:SAM-dependent methyltransferase